MKFFSFIRDISILVILFPTIISIVRYKNLNKGLKILFCFLCFGVFTEIAARILIVTGHTTLWALNIYIPIEFLLIGLMYACFFDGFINKKYVYILIVLFISISAVNSIYFQDLGKFNNLILALRSLIYVVFAIIYFYKVLTELKIQKLSKEPAIWINSSVLIVFSTIFLIMAFSNTILKLPLETAKYILGSQPIIFGLGYIIMGIGLLIASENKGKGYGN
jgi:hypothetical protein